MNLLITGGCGFIGSNLIRQIIDRPEVARLINLDCLTYAGHLENLRAVEHHPKYHFTRTDLRDQRAVCEVVRQHAISHVIHLAAESHVDRSITGPHDFISTNILGTFHLLEACRAAWPCTPAVDNRVKSGPRFLHVSTDEVFGSVGPTEVCTEASAYAPNSPYSASKASADFLVRSYHQTYGMSVVTSYSSNNYGPFQFPEKLIPVVIQSAWKRQPIPVYGDGQHVRDWLFVGDHTEALWQVLTRGRVGASYCIGGQNECTNLYLVGLICDWVDHMMPSLGGRSRDLITRVADRPGHDVRYAMDCTRIREELGWAPAHRFEEGLRETVRWYLEHPDWVRAVLEGSD